MNQSLFSTAPDATGKGQKEVTRDIMSPRLLAEYLGVDIRTVYRYLADNIIPSIKLPGKTLVRKHEITVLFASSNVGKSILAVQIAEDVAREEKVAYVDLELSTKQFQMRYYDPETHEQHIFPDNFYRAEIDPALITECNLENGILASIEEAKLKGYRFFIIDNITFICCDSEKGATAGSFMIKLKRLKHEHSLTIIVIAHTPKRRGYEPITQYDLAGSAVLINLFDAGFAMARSAKDPNIRYLKQVKVRTGEYLYDSENVMVMELLKDHGYLRFEVQGYANESDHLKTPGRDDYFDQIQDILRLQKEGASYQKIADTLGISKSMVQRRLKKAEKLDIKLDGSKTAGVSGVSTVSDTIQPIQAIRPIQQPDSTLPFNSEED